jgi:hypothetical protein
MEVLVVWGGLSLLAGYVASQKGRSAAVWFFVALLFSPLIGLLGALIVSSKKAPPAVDVRPAWMADPPPRPEIRPAWMVPAAPLAIDGPADALQALVAMKNRGLVTDDEYEAKRLELLARI